MEEKKPCVRGTALMRRARWLEKRLGEPDIPGHQYDAAEYAELLWVFQSLGLDFTAADEADKSVKKRKVVRRKEEPLEEPPVIKRGGDTFVPGEPRGKRYIPGGL